VPQWQVRERDIHGYAGSQRLKSYVREKQGSLRVLSQWHNVTHIMDSAHWTLKKIPECEKITVYMNTSFYAIKWDIFGDLCMALYGSDKLSFKEISRFLLPFLPPNHGFLFLFPLRVSFYLLMRGKSCSGAEKHSKIKRTLWLLSLETVKRCEMMSEYTGQES